MFVQCLQNACKSHAICKFPIGKYPIGKFPNLNSQTKANKSTKEIQTNVNWNPNSKTTHFRTGRSRTSGPLGSRTQDSDLGPDRVGPRSERSEWVWAQPEVRTPQGQVRLRSDFWKRRVRLLPDPPLSSCAPNSPLSQVTRSNSTGEGS